LGDGTNACPVPGGTRFIKFSCPSVFEALNHPESEYTGTRYM
jgi:hypothetical protein